VPIHDLGYRSWQGELRPAAVRWWVITQTGVRLAWRNRWLRRLVLLAWLPTLYLGLAFFLYEQWLSHAEESDAAVVQARQRVAEATRDALLAEAGQQGSAEARKAVADEARALAEAEAQRMMMRRTRRRAEEVLPGFRGSADRREVWAWMLWTFFRYPQGLLMLLLVGLTAPPLIARDLGSRAFLLYFARPLSRVEYIVGKLAIVWTFVSLITAAPALALYLLGVMLSPEPSVVASTWDLPLRILGASIILMIPTASLALAFSSLTTRSWAAGFAWFAVWVMGLVAYLVLQTSLSFRLDPRWSLISLYHTLGSVQVWVFDVDVQSVDVLLSAGGVGAVGVWPCAILLTGLTIASLFVLFARISSVIRA
jgi:hypothetical protein